MKLQHRVALVNYATGEYHSAARDALLSAAERRGLSTLVFAGGPLASETPEEVAGSGVYNYLKACPIDGVVVVVAPLTLQPGVDAATSLCRSLGPLPVCTIGLPLTGFSGAGSDDRAGTYALVEHLFACHRLERLAFVGGHHSMPDVQARRAAFERAHRDRGLTVDPALVVDADCTLESAEAAIDILLQERRVRFTGIVCANDLIAMGVMEALRRRGFRIPEDVRVVGFDDTDVARSAAPALTSVQQPFAALAELSLDLLSCAAAGRAAQHVTLATPLVIRQSCGCALGAKVHVAAPAREGRTLRGHLGAQRRVLLQSWAQTLQASDEALAFGWCDRLLDALQAELAGARGAFLSALRDSLAQGLTHDTSPERFETMLRIAYAQLEPRLDEDEASWLDGLWQQALLLIGTAMMRREGRRRATLEQATYRLQLTGSRLATVQNEQELHERLLHALSDLELESVAMARCDSQGGRQLAPWIHLRDGTAVPLVPVPEGAPAAAAVFEEPGSYVIAPLGSGAELFGMAVFRADISKMIAYEALCEQVTYGLKVVRLHAQVAREIARRGRAERRHMQRELDLARDLQMALSPRDGGAIHGLELSACMAPATEVGGDYYDVLPMASGIWLGIGDVAGHGLAAGLTMLTIHSAVSALVRALPDAGPSDLVERINRVVYGLTRSRLGLDDHATFMLLRLDPTGRLSFAGGHEDLLVYRARHGSVEVIPTEGTWIGAVADIRGACPERVLTLEPGDLLVLYTDGVIEARDAQGRELGLEGITAVLESHAQAPVTVIRDAIEKTVRCWMHQQSDDYTVIVGRYLGT